MTRKQQTVAVGERALQSRVNRALANQSQRLHKSVKRDRSALGRYYLVEHGKRFDPIVRHIDLERFARKLGVLHEWERLQAAP